MHILVGLLVGGFVLWLWLGGHWFGRVLAFLVFSVTSVCFALANVPDGPSIAAVAVMSSLVAVAVSWVLATLPIWIYRQRTLDQ